MFDPDVFDVDEPPLYAKIICVLVAAVIGVLAAVGAASLIYLSIA